jgi:hypothetical protein
MSLLKPFVVIFGLLPVFSFGQLHIPKDTLRKMYDRQTLIFLSNRILKDGQIQPRKLFSHPLRDAVRNDLGAHKTFQKANRQLWGGAFLIAMSVVPLATGIGNRQGNAQISQAGATALTLGSAAAMGFGLWLNAKALNGFHETVWQYNRNAILNGLHLYNDSTNRAQALRSYEQNTIRRTNFGFYHNGHYERMGVLGFYDPLKNRLRPNIAAYSLYQRGSWYRNTGTAFGYASALGNIYAASQLMGIPKSFADVQKALTLSLVSSVVGLLSTYLTVQGENEIQRAVWFYNRDAFANGVF